MFAIPGIVALIALIYLRPQEVFEALQTVPWLYLFLGLAIFGMVIDVRLRISRLAAAPALRWSIVFYVWVLFTIAIRNLQALQADAIELAVSVTLFFVVAHGVQTFRSFQVVAASILTVCLFVAFVGVHQHFQPRQCIDASGGLANISAENADGRICESRDICYGEGAEPGADYVCENVGLMGTTSVGGGRVRYRGVLQDPNELALATSIALPFAFAFRERKRSAIRTALAVGALALIACCTIFTMSRGGQLVFLAVLGAYFVKKYGIKGALAGAVLALPLLLFGGRSGEEAEGSAAERLECWYEGMAMLRMSPLVGVGGGRFTDYHYLTAHNAYILALAETGLPGFVLWSILLYLSVKGPLITLKRVADRPEAAVAKTWAMALVAACFGLYVGIFFLSFTYHYVLWIYFGLCGAFYSAMKRHDPEFEVRFGWKDFALLFAGDLALTVLLFVYTRLKVG